MELRQTCSSHSSCSRDDDNERTYNELETGNPVFTPPVDVEGYEGEGQKKKQE